MRLKTILTMPGLDKAERISRLKEWAAIKIAWAVPKQVAYWAFVRLVVTAEPNGDPTNLTVKEIMERSEVE